MNKKQRSIPFEDFSDEELSKIYSFKSSPEWELFTKVITAKLNRRALEQILQDQRVLIQMIMSTDKHDAITATLLAVNDLEVRANEDALLLNIPEYALQELKKRKEENDKANAKI